MITTPFGTMAYIRRSICDVNRPRGSPGWIMPDLRLQTCQGLAARSASMFAGKFMRSGRGIYSPSPRSLSSIMTRFTSPASTSEVDLMLAAPKKLPLYGKRVIVTAPRQYAQTLCQKLLAVGARPLWVAGVLISSLEEDQCSELDSTLQTLDRFTHIAFTSKNGIYAFLQRLQHILEGASGETGGEGLGRAISHLASLPVRLCALGADGRVLQQMGLKVHVAPKEASTQGLVKELVERGEVEQAQVLCPVPHVTGGLVEPSVVPLFIEALQAAGAIPTRVPAYLTTVALTPKECAAERAMLEAGDVHAIAFSSTAEAQGLALLMGGVAALRAAVQRQRVCLAAHGPYTASGASRVLGMDVDCVSENFSTFDGLVTALQARFAGDSSSN